MLTQFLSCACNMMLITVDLYLCSSSCNPPLSAVRADTVVMSYQSHHNLKNVCSRCSCLFHSSKLDFSPLSTTVVTLFSCFLFPTKLWLNSLAQYVGNAMDYKWLPVLCPFFHQEMEPASPLSFTGQLFSLASGITVSWEWHHAIPAVTAFFLVLLEHSCHVAMPRQNCWMVRGHMEGWGHTRTRKRTEIPTSGRHRQAPSCRQLYKWPPAEEEPPSWAQPIRILEKNYSSKPPEFPGGFYKTLDHWNRKLKNQASVFPSILTVWFFRPFWNISPQKWSEFSFAYATSSTWAIFSPYFFYLSNSTRWVTSSSRLCQGPHDSVTSNLS